MKSSNNQRREPLACAKSGACKEHIRSVFTDSERKGEYLLFLNESKRTRMRCLRAREAFLIFDPSCAISAAAINDISDAFLLFVHPGTDIETNHRKKFVGVCALYVLDFYIFRPAEKKLFRQMWDMHKKVSMVLFLTTNFQSAFPFGGVYQNDLAITCTFACAFCMSATPEVKRRTWHAHRLTSLFSCVPLANRCLRA